MKKKILCAVLCLVLAIPVFGACGKKQDDSVLTVFRWDFAQINNAKKVRSPLYKKVKEVIGVDIDAQTAGSSSWEGVINNKYQTGDLPDMFVSYAMDRPLVYEKWIKDGAVLPISDYVSETEYPNVYNRLKEFDYLKERLPYAKGKHYALPISTTLEHGMFIRTDWIDNLNRPAKLTAILTDELGHAPSATELENNRFKIPENLIEFYRVARAFSKYDPDGDGRNDNTYGYTSSETNMWFNNWIFEAFDTTFFGMVEDGNGGLTASWVTDENKNAVAFMNRLYNEGILDPDYINTNANQKIEKFVKGQVGIMVSNIWYNTILNKFKSATGKSDEEAKNSFAIILPPKGENGNYGMRGNAGFWCCTAIRGDVSPAKRTAALKLLDFLLSEEGEELFTYGMEGIHYKVENGEKVSLMGTDSDGFNYTLSSKDPAFELTSLVDWKKSYCLPFMTNGDIVADLLAKAAAYSRVDPVLYVQTPLFVEKEQTLGSNSINAFVSMIANKSIYNSGGYDTTKIPAWDDLINGSVLDSEWNAFKNDYLVKWGGQAMISEYSAAAKQYL